MQLAEAHATLAAILDPLPPDTFLDDVLGRSFVKLDGTVAEARRHLLGPDPRAALLDAFTALAPTLTCHAETATALPPTPGPVADATAFRALIEDYHARGYTVRIPDLRGLSLALDALLAALEALFHQPAEVAAFWSRGDARAPIHYDKYDLIAVQLVGAKRWFISGDPPSLTNPWKGIAEGPPPLTNPIEVEVGPGDLLYLPRGTPHRVEALAESIHLSIGFVPLTLREAIIAALDHLAELDRPLRETVGRHLGLAVRANRFGQLPAAVRAGAERLAAVARDERFIAEALQRRSSRAIGDLPKLARPAASPALAPTTRLAHSPLALCHLSANAQSIDVAYPGGHIAIHRGAEDAVRFIAATPSFRIGELPGPIGDEIRVALAQRFVDSGILVVDEGRPELA